MLLTFFLGYLACASVRNYMMYRLDSRTNECLKADENGKLSFSTALQCLNEAQWTTTEKLIMLYYRKGE